MTEYQRLKIFLNKMNITQAEVSDMFGIDRSTMSKMLNGKIRLQIDLLQKLHYKYFLNLNWLLCGTGKMKCVVEDKNNYLEDSSINYNNYNELKEEINELKKRIDFLTKIIEKIAENKDVKINLIQEN